MSIGRKGRTAPAEFRSVDNEGHVRQVAYEQLHRYKNHRNHSRWLYQWTELLLLVFAALTTVSAAIRAESLLTALLAAGTVVLTGFRQVFDPHGRWIACVLAWMDARSAIWAYEFRSSHDVAARGRLIEALAEVGKGETSRWVSAERLRRELTPGSLDDRDHFSGSADRSRSLPGQPHLCRDGRGGHMRARRYTVAHIRPSRSDPTGPARR